MGRGPWISASYPYQRRRFVKINWAAVGAFLTSAVGVITDPHVLSLLPSKYSVALVALGTIWGAFTHPVAKPAE